jgi:hypothetical protein
MLRIRSCRDDGSGTGDGGAPLTDHREKDRDGEERENQASSHRFDYAMATGSHRFFPQFSASPLGSC